jgi:hypothetical protein
LKKGQAGSALDCGGWDSIFSERIEYLLVGIGSFEYGAGGDIKGRRTGQDA